LIGTIAAMGEGLNLQRASTAIFVDQEWSTIKMTQAYDRIHRLDITEPKVIYLLHCANTVDNLILEALTNKWSQTELVYAALSYLRNHST
jgi:SNF2 family DNA or RNA helicase